jgi:uncharacterized protein (TIGR00369 family)
MEKTVAGINLRASPIRETLGIRYLSKEPGRVSAEFSPGPEFTNANGTVQGGILSSFLDHVMGQSSYTLVGPEDRLITLEMSLKFLEPVWPGVLRGQGWVIKKGNAVLFSEGQIFGPEGRVAVKASTSLFLIRS